MKTVLNPNHSAKETMKFTLFSDLHYKKGMFIAGVSDLEAIMKRADQTDSQFVLHAGDLCNDYLRSPELTNAYLNNAYGLSVYGVYGNHELESKGNSMQVVTPMLTNRKVVWGTDDGEIGDGSIAYYYFDHDVFRVICLDTNYSWNTDLQQWQHNQTASWGAPTGNIKSPSLGFVQLEWLKNILQEAVKLQLHCIVVSHRGFCEQWFPSPDGEAVRELFHLVNNQRRGTVLMAISGDIHTNHHTLVDDVVYLDVHTVRNGLWQPNGVDHYEGMTFPYVNYDSDGHEIARYDRPISELSMARQTWFFDEPLSAVVTVSTNGEVKIEGANSHWYGDVIPSIDWTAPHMSNGYYKPFGERSI